MANVASPVSALTLVLESQNPTLYRYTGLNANCGEPASGERSAEKLAGRQPRNRARHRCDDPQFGRFSDNSRSTVTSCPGEIQGQRACIQQPRRRRPRARVLVERHRDSGGSKGSFITASDRFLAVRPNHRRDWTTGDDECNDEVRATTQQDLVGYGLRLICLTSHARIATHCRPLRAGANQVCPLHHLRASTRRCGAR